jgi:uncharacterized membrane protein
MKLGERISDAVTKFVGSWKFIFLFSFFLLSWMIINSLALFNVIAWDKPPFILLNLILSFIAAFQAPFIMMSQNRAEKKQDEAYKQLFNEIKKLVEYDISNSLAVKSLSEEIKKLVEYDIDNELEIKKLVEYDVSNSLAIKSLNEEVKSQQAKMLEVLSKNHIKVY